MMNNGSEIDSEKLEHGPNDNQVESDDENESRDDEDSVIDDFYMNQIQEANSNKRSRIRGLSRKTCLLASLTLLLLAGAITTAVLYLVRGDLFGRGGGANEVAAVEEERPFLNSPSADLDDVADDDMEQGAFVSGSGINTQPVVPPSTDEIGNFGMNNTSNTWTAMELFDPMLDDLNEDFSNVGRRSIDGRIAKASLSGSSMRVAVLFPNYVSRPSTVRVYGQDGSGQWVRSTEDVLRKGPDAAVSLSLSGTGTVLAVAYRAGVGSFESGLEVGHGYVVLYDFLSETSSWSTTTVLTGIERTDGFGSVVQLDFDGDTLAVSAPTYGMSNGYVDVYFRPAPSSSWQPRGKLPSCPTKGCMQGSTMALSGDGNHLVVSAANAVRAYRWMGRWNELGNGVAFPGPVAISSNGNVVAVESYSENGVVRVYELSPGERWIEKIGSSRPGHLGALSNDGTKVLVISKDHKTVTTFTETDVGAVMGVGAGVGMGGAEVKWAPVGSPITVEDDHIFGGVTSCVRGDNILVWTHRPPLSSNGMSSLQSFWRLHTY